MTYQTAFPDFDRATEIDALIAAGWRDESWQNDSAPRVHCGDAVIWIDYADADKSEVAAMGGEAGQCTVEYLRDGCFAGDDAQPFPTIKAALGAIYAKTIGYDPFEDDPMITIAEVAETLVGYEAEARAA
jgi:hypothetical protein